MAGHLENIDPVQFFWDHLGQYLLPLDEVTGDIQADVNRALIRTYQHAKSNLQRVAEYFVQERRTIEMDPPAAVQAARCQAGHDLLERTPAGFELTNAEQNSLQKACEAAKKQSRKIKKQMDGVRLSQKRLIPLLPVQSTSCM